MSKENSYFLPETDTVEVINADEPGRCDENDAHCTLHNI